ncbi:MAG: triphosphoribosyl-dephospho-CoA synthase [Opitutaceae bacterium]|nr:triphosphoribosyl-dephospho-CoA synthase [Opitutaceae bacterium]
MNSSRISEVDRLAAFLVQGATLELHLTPKPGLVDLKDCGSHPDLTVALMEQSLTMVSDCLQELIGSLGRGEDFAQQVSIAQRAEKRMHENLGSNTHKGYLFLSGLMLIARWHARTADERIMRDTIGSLAGNFFASQGSLPTHGQKVRGRFPVGGIVQESIHGFPSLFEEAIPAYLAAMEQHGCFQKASFSMLARLMQVVEDTTALHRCGATGLEQIRHDGRRLEKIINQGGNFLPILEELNRQYIRMNLTMGGVADMLGLSYGYLLASGNIPEGDQSSAHRLADRSASPVPAFEPLRV